MAKLKHSKYKNTYLLYEFLVRQTTNDVVNGIQIKESPAYNIIKEYFGKGILKKELNVYNTLLKESIINDKDSSSGDFLLNEVSSFHKSLNQNLLNRTKYNLVKEIKKHYNLDSLVNTRIPNYKEIATVYLFLEANRKNDFISKAKYRNCILEVLKRPKINEEEQLKDIYEGYDKDEIKLAFNLLVKKFNLITENKLNANQKSFIRDFVYQNTDESSWVSNHISKIKKLLSESISKLSNDDDGKVIKIKLNEVSNHLSILEKKKIYSDEDYQKIMYYYELIDVLK